MLECTRSRKHTLSASTCTQWQTHLNNCHPILPTVYRDSPGPDIIEFPLPQTNQSRQTSASGLPGTQHSSFNTREDVRETDGLQTRSRNCRWIPNRSTRSQKIDPKWKPTMQYVATFEGRTNSILLCKDMWSCAFTACCWQRVKVLA